MTVSRQSPYDFSMNIYGEANTPSTNELFIINEKSKCSDNFNKEYFHSEVN